jgi:NADPH:quinone reductase-like Zn-dependent oxidoreductase
VRFPAEAMTGMKHRTRRLHFCSGFTTHGRFQPQIDDHPFTMENAVDAYRYMLTGEQVGKIVVQVSA